MLYFDWDTKDFQKALLALTFSPINGNFFTFILGYDLHSFYLFLISPFQCIPINLSNFLKLGVTFIFAISAFISLFGILLVISCFYSKTTPENVQHVNTSSTLQSPARFNCDWSLLTENSLLFFFLQLKKQDIDFNLLWDNFLFAWYGLISIRLPEQDC